MNDRDLRNRGITKYGIILYRIKALEVKKLDGGLWLKRIRVYHPVGLFLFVFMLALTPLMTLFIEESIQSVTKGIIEQFIIGVKST
jgi:hypothetical protein